MMFQWKNSFTAAAGQSQEQICFTRLIGKCSYRTDRGMTDIQSGSYLLKCTAMSRSPSGVQIVAVNKRFLDMVQLPDVEMTSFYMKLV